MTSMFSLDIYISVDPYRTTTNCDPWGKDLIFIIIILPEVIMLICLIMFRVMLICLIMFRVRVRLNLVYIC